MALPARLILLHKQGSSGRLRFFRLPSGVLAFAPLPAPGALREEGYSPVLLAHPAALVRQAESRLGLADGAIEPVADFQAWVDTPQGDIAVLLAAFTAIDPPFAAAERAGGCFIALTEARPLPEIERSLLRRAYEHLLG